MGSVPLERGDFSSLSPNTNCFLVEKSNVAAGNFLKDEKSYFAEERSNLGVGPSVEVVTATSPATLEFSLFKNCFVEALLDGPKDASIGPSGLLPPDPLLPIIPEQSAKPTWSSLLQPTKCDFKLDHIDISEFKDSRKLIVPNVVADQGSR